MNRYEFRLTPSSEQCFDYYRGVAQQVIVRCATGQTVQFPASLLRPYVTMDGIYGRFVLTCDADHKHPELQRLDAAR